MDCAGTFSNWDELDLIASTGCHIDDRLYAMVNFINSVSHYIVFVYAIIKLLPSVRENVFAWNFIPHANATLWGMHGLYTGSVYLYKALHLAKISRRGAALPLFTPIAL